MLDGGLWQYPLMRARCDGLATVVVLTRTGNVAANSGTRFTLIYKKHPLPGSHQPRSTVQHQQRAGGPWKLGNCQIRSTCRSRWPPSVDQQRWRARRRIPVYSFWVEGGGISFEGVIIVYHDSCETRFRGVILYITYKWSRMKSRRIDQYDLIFIKVFMSMLTSNYVDLPVEYIIELNTVFMAS